MADAPMLPSLWLSITQPAVAPPLVEDAKADVCVVGAGIAGLTTAYLLAAAGKSVVVIDAGGAGTDQTSHTTAHLSNAIDDRYREVERIRGEDAARLAAESHSAAIDRIEQIARDEGIGCDFSRLNGYLFLAPGQAMEDLEDELRAALRAGLPVELLPRAPLSSLDTGPCLCFPRQAQIQPVAYMLGLTRAVLSRGVRIFGSTLAQGIENGATARVKTQQGAVVEADAVVVATNVPFHNRLTIHTKLAAYATYVIAAPVPHGSVAPGLYWDDADPYHYVRLHQLAGEDLLIVGGEDHRAGHDDGHEQLHFVRLEGWARERFPQLGEVRHRWTGQVMETLDGLAFIGADPLGAPNVFVATGDSGMGMTHGTIAGMLLTDLVVGRANPWTKLYEPSRMPIAASGKYAAENLRTLRRYADWLTPGDRVSAKDIAPGHGAVLRQGLHKIAAYRDLDGRLHEFSAVCSHLGCLVHWNDAEACWNCPCHGSRFGALGAVLNGPATQDLEPVSEIAAQERQASH